METKPLSLQSALPIVKLLKDHPDLEIYVTDAIAFFNNDPEGKNQMGPYAIVLEPQSILIINRRRTQELQYV